MENVPAPFPKKRFPAVYVLVLAVIVLGLLFSLFLIKPSQIEDMVDNVLPGRAAKSKSPFSEVASNSGYKSQLNNSVGIELEKTECVLPDKPAPYISEDVTVPGVKDEAGLDDYWMLNILQPVVLRYFSLSGVGYMVGGIGDSSGSCKKIAFVVSDNTEINDKSSLYKPNKSRVADGEITFEDYQQKFPVGIQVRVSYLGRRPASNLLVDELCDYKPPHSQYYCTIQRISERYSATVIDYRFRDHIFYFPWQTEQIYIVFTDFIED